MKLLVTCRVARRVKCLALFAAVMFVSSTGPAEVVLKGMEKFESPSGNIAASVWVDGSGRLVYSISKNGVTALGPSPLGPVVAGDDLGEAASLAGEATAEKVEIKRPTRGDDPVASASCTAAVLPVSGGDSGKAWQLEAWTCDSGFALRYHIPSDSDITFTGEATGFRPAPIATMYYQDNLKNYEGLFKTTKVEKAAGYLGMPVTIVLPGDAGYMAITEADNFGHSGAVLSGSGNGLLSVAFDEDESWPDGPHPDGKVKTPWRIVMLADDLNGLVNCDLVDALAAPTDPELFADADWIKPGRAFWSWWSEGTGKLELQKEYADAASKMGYEYILVDEGWELWWKPGKNKWEHIKELVDYAEERDVKVWVWKRWKKLSRKSYRDFFFEKVKDAGVVGVKIDFMDSEDEEMLEFYEAALADAARHKLMINFHGANKPTGESVTYPNEMTREGIRGLEYNRFGAPLPASYNATLPFTRYLAGHGDYTPVTFNERRMGDTSYSHQLATSIVFISPAKHIAGDPSEFLENDLARPALPVLKELPTVWDETVVLPGSEIGVLAGFARRSGDTWWVAVLNGGEAREYGVDLSFLDGGKYEALVLSDRAESKTGFEETKTTVKKGDIIKKNMRESGGMVVVLKPGE